jgi:hypothetical protein
MGNGSTNSSGGGDDQAQSSVSSAKASFADSAPGPVTGCSAAPNPVKPGGGTEGGAAPEPCPAATIKGNLAACDGGTHVWDDAKKTIGKDPTVKLGPVAGGFEANTDITSGLITIAPTPDCCAATQSLFFELTNVKSSPRHKAVDDSAAAGNVGREEYTKKEAKIEWDGVKLLRDNFAKCKGKWGCSDSATTGYEGVSDDFDKYYASQTTTRYKDYYRHAWDDVYKTAYVAKNPTGTDK